jgi:hypothetical protein
MASSAAENIMKQQQQPIIQIFLSAIEQAILSSTINGASDSFFWNQNK